MTWGKRQLISGRIAEMRTSPTQQIMLMLVDLKHDICIKNNMHHLLNEKSPYVITKEGIDFISNLLLQMATILNK